MGQKLGKRQVGGRNVFYMMSSRFSSPDNPNLGLAVRVPLDPLGSHPSAAIREEDLYPEVVAWVAGHSIQAKRIDEKRSRSSRGKEGNKWLFADLAGFRKIGKQKGYDFATEILMEKGGVARLCFYSFEVKVKLNRSSVRQSYFQTISNSTWANFGY